MKLPFLLITFFIGLIAGAQQERDTIVRRCPVSITDTVSVNNFFIEGLSATIKVYRVKGKLTIQIMQKDQFFTLFFHDKRLKNKTYTIEPGSRGRYDVEAAYSFKSGEQSSFINVSNGKVESVFDKEKNMWRLKVTGTIRNMVERTVTYYRVKSDFFIL
jgi:hypothetical protein